MDWLEPVRRIPPPVLGNEWMMSLTGDVSCTTENGRNHLAAFDFRITSTNTITIIPSFTSHLVKGLGARSIKQAPMTNDLLTR